MAVLPSPSASATKQFTPEEIQYLQSRGYGKFLAAYGNPAGYTPQGYSRLTEQVKQTAQAKSQSSGQVGKLLSQYQQSRQRARELGEDTSGIDARIAKLEGQLQDLRRQESLSGKLVSGFIKTREEVGGKVPAPVPKSEYSYEGETFLESGERYNPSKGYLKRGGETYRDVAGYTTDSRGALVGIIQSEGRTKSTYDVRTGRKIAYQDEARFFDYVSGDSFDLVPPDERTFEYRLTANPFAAPPNVESAGSFIDTINRQFEAQVIVAEKKGDIYTAYFNPKLGKSSNVDEFVAEKLMGFGFTQSGDEFFYSQPTEETAMFAVSAPVKLKPPKQPKQAKVMTAEKDYFDFSESPPPEDSFLSMPTEEYLAQFKPGNFDFSKSPPPEKFVGGQKAVLLGEVTKEERAKLEPYVKDYNFYGKENTLGRFFGEDKSNLYKLGSAEEAFFSPTATPERELFSADYSKGVSEFVQEKTGNQFLAGGVGFVAESVEDYFAKPIIAAGVVARGVPAAVLAPNEETRFREAGNVYAAYPSFARAPFAAATLVSMLNPAQVTDKAAIKAAEGAGTRVLSERIFEESPGVFLKETEYGLFTRSMYLSPSQVAFENIKISAAGFGRQAAQLSAPLVSIGKESVRYGAAGAGVQSGLEFTLGAAEGFPKGFKEMLQTGVVRLQSPEAQQRIAAAGVGFALIGGGAEAGKQVSAPISGYLGDRTAPYTDFAKSFGYSIRQLPQTAARETGIFATSAFFLANTPKEHIPPPNTESVGYNLAARATQMQLNPFQGQVKPAIMGAKTRLREVTSKTEYGVSFIPPPKASTATLSPKASPALQRAIRTGISRDFSRSFIGDRGFEISRASSITSTGAQSRETPAEANPVREAARMEAIEQAILSERGRLKTEQFAAFAQRQRGGFRQSYRTREGENLYSGVLEFTGTPEATRLYTPERERLRLEAPERPPKTPAGFIPSIKIPMVPEFPQGKGKREKVPRSYTYTVSLTGLFTGKREGKRKKSYTGFEVRGIPKLRRGNVVL